MCTVSWALEKGGYRLFFNRDEQKSRTAAEPPELWESHEATFLGPRDPVGKGTWIAVNPAGWTTAILNHYEKEVDVAPSGARSRGELVRILGGLRSNDDVEAQFKKLPVKEFAPFLLLRVSPAGKGQLWTSDGSRLATQEIDPSDLPITTSSVDTERVIERRSAIYHALNAGAPATTETLRMYHRHFDLSDGAASVCMRREDAETVSLCEVSVKAKLITFDYYERKADGPGFERPLNFSLKREA